MIGAAPWRRVRPRLLRAVLGDPDSLALAVSSLAGFAVRVAGVVLMTAVTVLLTRLLGAEEYGRLAFLLSGGFIVVIFAGLGLPTAASRLVPRYLARGRRDIALHYLLFALAAVTPVACAAGATLAALLELLPSVFGRYRFPAAGVVGLVVTLALMRVASDTSRALGLPMAGFVAESVAVRLILLAALAAFVAAGLPLSAGAALALYVGAQTAVVLGVVALVLARMRPGPGAVRPRPPRLYRGWLGVSLAMLATPVYYFLLFETDVVALGVLSGPYDVGLYQVARRLAEFAVFAAGTASAVGLPRLARAHAERRPDRLQATVDVMNLISVGSTLAIVLGLLVAGPVALRLFGPEFAQGYPVLLVLALGRLAAVLLGPASDLLLMTGHHRRLGRVNVAFAVINLALNLALIPRFGALGAAIATSVASLGWTAWLYGLARRLTPVDTSVFGRLRRARPPGAT